MTPPEIPACASCRWWDAEDDERADAARGFSTIAPCCIRSTPGAFPSRSGDEWCGEHAPRPIQRMCRMHPNVPVTDLSTYCGHALCDACWVDVIDARERKSEDALCEKIRRGPDALKENPDARP